MQSMVAQIHFRFQWIRVPHGRHFTQIHHVATDSGSLALKKTRGRKTPARPRSALILDGGCGEIDTRFE